MERAEIEAGYRSLQDRIGAGLSAFDPTAALTRDRWKRPGGGGGETRILRGQEVEKAAVNFSAVWGTVAEQHEFASSASFYASGISVIVHPRNPHAPSFHANLRYLEVGGEESWFGGGCDLTPCYLYEEDAHHFHRVLKEACQRHPWADFGEWKKACDTYFFLPHRGEARGLGGIFFDRLPASPESWRLMVDLGESFLSAYRPILERRSRWDFTEDQQAWQELRRGRYVEFNLVYDRGTRFGLETGGRAESILASLPPRARWDYGVEPAPDTPEAELMALLRAPPREWA
jgi:coproporphyrinogen III oxidase